MQIRKEISNPERICVDKYYPSQSEGQVAKNIYVF